MGVIKTSKYQDVLVTDSNKAQAKGKSKKKDPKADISKPKHNQQTFEGASDSKKKKKFKKKMCPYCMRGFHLEYSCMKKQVDQLTALLKQNNIALPQRENNPDDEPQPEDDETWHSLKAILVQPTTYIIDYGAFNHIVCSK